MREIKFRAFDDGKMIYSHNNSINSDIQQVAWFFGKVREDAFIMQFTGLTDKNGTPIFEGDIIKHNEKKFISGWSKIFGTVFIEINKNLGSFIEDGVVMKNHNRRSHSEIANYLKYCKVIGNIHENKELLK
jgi:uncharacterized phage protein (TIGR01671 family)